MPQPLFLEGSKGRLFAVYHPSRESPPALRVLIVPPFGEELNKSRRIMAVTARRLSMAGCDVLLVDLFGTGDSDGEFRESSWDTWVSDVETATRFLAERTPNAVSAVIAIRTGALLLASMVERANFSFERVLLWQPVLKGEQFLNQFLRIRAMASRFEGHDESVAGLSEHLRTGHSVEVGGYELTPHMAEALRTATAQSLSSLTRCRIDLMEFRTSPEADASLPSRNFVDQLISRNIDARCRVAPAEAFWATQEIIAPVEIAEQTVAVLLGE
jgi:exosortase A-associated hydrolase 2